MGFFMFLMISFDALAWPILALGYPLVASVRAIETNSDTDCRKLVTYWVLFSLISLFEHAFMDLLRWVLVWDYVKLMMVCWLMIPRFNGAFHVYNNFVHPCLSMDLQTIINCFIKLKDRCAKKEDFLTEAEKYVKANGSEALVKLISANSSSIKPSVQTEMEAPAKQDGMSEGIEPCIMQKDSQNACASLDTMSPTSQILEKKVVTAVKQVPEAELNVAPANDTIPPPVEIKEAATSGISTLPQVQKEWTCAMCQVTVSSEKTLMDHLQGSRHKVTCDKLKEAKNQAFKGKDFVPSASKSTKTPKKEPEKGASSNTTAHKESDQKTGRRQAGKSDFPKDMPVKSVGGDKPKPQCNVKGQQEIEKNEFVRQAGKSDFPKDMPVKSVGGDKPKPQCNVKGQQEIEKNEFVRVKDNKFWCSICNISCTSSENMVSHLNGKKHMSQIQN